MIDIEMETQLYRLAVKQWGADAQMLMLVEECAELATVVCHKLRGRLEGDAPLLDGLADVSIMLGQISALVDDAELEKVRQQKLERLKRRLEKYVRPSEFGGSP